MLNLYPQRATNPNDMHIVCDDCILSDNVNEISGLLDKYEYPVIWAAWGTLIEKRSYLKQCLSRIVKELDKKTVAGLQSGIEVKKDILIILCI
jgi:hypothetical protein